MRVAVKVEHSRPSVESLAVKLAEALHGASRYQVDVRSFRASAAQERRKGAELVVLIHRTKEWRRNPPAKISRMEPLAQYDLDAMWEERKLALRRAGRFDEVAAEYARKIVECEGDAAHLQREIREERERARNGV